MDGCKELESVQNENKANEDKAKVEGIRKIAMETHSEASKRKSEVDDETCYPSQNEDQEPIR